MKRQHGIAIIALLAGLLVTMVTIIIILPDHPSPKASSKSSTPTPQLTATVWNDPLAAARAAFQPVKIMSPKIKLAADVIPVGPTSTGAMATPSCSSVSDPVCEKTFWWSSGTVPGQQGNTVIAGHVNRLDNSPGVFWYISQLVAGDTFQIQVANGMTLTFAVTRTEKVSAYANGANDPTIGEIFGPASTPNVNLITCTGDWDGSTFDHRLVVHSTLVGNSPFPH
jgi:Sortase domain